MDDWFCHIASGSELSAVNLRILQEVGFVIIPGPLQPHELVDLAKAYDSAVASAGSDDVAIGGSTIRVHDFVNRGPEFDGLYVYRPALEACWHIIGQPFKLSTMLARTVRPHSQAQALHVDFKRDVHGWPMVGFILLVDGFRIDNGATRFVPTSHNWSAIPTDYLNDPVSDFESQVLACAPAGSLIIYNGSVWHGHTANSSAEPRRSIQGAYIRRSAKPGINFSERMRPDTLDRIDPLAKYLLDI